MVTRFKDYYEVLGVARDADPKEVKAAFRKLARRCHPDVSPNDKAAEERFKEINEAHEVLSDPEKRRKYDELGPRWHEYEAWEKAGRPGPSPFGQPQVEYHTVSSEDLGDLFGGSNPFSGFFHDVFGRSAREPNSPTRQGEDIVGDAEISLEEASTGTTRTVEIGDRAGGRRVQVRIPAGIGDGARVRAAGQGARGRGGGVAGDLYVRVLVRPHATFRREGSTLHVRVAVPLDILLLGGEVPVSTLTGTTVQLRIPAGTQNGTKLRLRGLGMPHLRGEGSGDLIAEVQARLPATVTPELRQLAEAVRRQREEAANAG